MQSLISYFTFALLVTLGVGCTQSKDFSTEACINNNLNCSTPSTTIDLVGGDENQHGINVDGSGNDVGDVQVKTIRYGENAVIEFLITNPKLNPLKNFQLTMSPAAPEFQIIPGRSADSCSDNVLIYKETCAVAIKYIPGKIPPGLINLTFAFKTMTGGDFTFISAFDPAVLLADFYIQPGDLELPDTMTYPAGALSGIVTGDITIENTSSKSNDALTIAALEFRESTCRLTATADQCIQGSILPSQSADTCNIKVEFIPQENGPEFCTLDITATNGTFRSYTFKGRGTGLNTSVKNIDFGILAANAAPSTKQAVMTVGKDSLSTSASTCSLSSDLGAQFQISSTPVLPATLAADAELDISVQFTPESGKSSYKGTVTVTCNNRGGSLSIPVSAGTTSENLISSASDINFSDTLIGGSSTQSITFTNASSTDTLTNIESTISSQLGEGFTITGGNCTGSLPPGQSCSAEVTFSPSSSGTVTGTLQGSSSEGAMTPGVSLSGSGIGLQSSHATLDFGTLQVGQDRPGPTITVTNPSNTTAEGCSISSTGLQGTGFSIDEESSCLSKTQFSAGEVCEIKPRYAAASEKSGPQSGNIHLQCTKGGSLDIALSAQVQANLNLVLLPPSSNTWPQRLVGISEDIEAVFMNQGSSALTTLSLQKNGVTSPWSESSNTCTNNLAAGALCKVTLTYAPLATPGNEQVGDSLGSIRGQASGLSDVIYNFAATAVKVTVNPSQLNIGTSDGLTALFSSQRLYFTNPSNLDTATGCSLNALTTFEIEESSCNGSLAPEAQCSVLVKVPPGLVSGDITEALSYTCIVGGRATANTNAKVERKAQLAWSGSANYGPVVLGNNQEQTFTLTHTGTGLDKSATGLQISLNPSSSSYSLVSHNCPSTLTVGASCTATVRFAPSANGTHIINLVASASDTSAAYNLSGAGVSSGLNLQFSSTNIAFDPIELGSATTQTETITITNYSETTTNLAYPALSAPFARGGTCGATLASGASCTLEITASADSTQGQVNSTIAITETQAGYPDAHHSINLQAQTWAAPVLSIKDNRAQTSYVTTDILTTDVTGAPDSANNIIDLSPASRSVVFNIGNMQTNAFPIENLAVALTKNSGPVADPQEHMRITADTCTGTDLSSTQECTITVTYYPTAIRETPSSYSLDVTGSYNSSPVTISAQDIQGRSYKSVELAEDFAPTSLLFSLISSATTDETTAVTLSNLGDVSATNLQFSFTGSNANHFATTANTCGASLAGGANCSFKLQFKPTNAAVAAKTQFDITSDQDNLIGIADLKGASYTDFQDDPSSLTSDGYEPEIASDSNKFYVVSKTSDDSTYQRLRLQICDKDSTSENILPATCGSSILNVAGEPYWAGAFVGYKMNTQITENKILAAVSNQENDKTAANTGISTVLICNKTGITGANTLDFTTSCSRTNIHSISVNTDSGLAISPIKNQGAFTSMHTHAGKMVLGAENADGFSITACSYDDTATTATALSSCKTYVKSGLGSNQAEFTDISYDGSKIVMVSHKVNQGLFGIVCSLGTDNALTCGDYSLIDGDSLINGAYTMIAGAHPYLIIENGNAVIASQQGSVNSQGLRLAKCLIQNLSLTGCQNKTIAQATGADGFGLNPSMKVLQRGDSSIAWIQSVSFNSFTNIASGAKKISLYSCDISDFATPCSSRYFQQATSSSAPIYAREMDLNLTKNILTIPFTTGDNYNTGFLSIGLSPEL